jgi:hypothetical protein
MPSTSDQYTDVTEWKKYRRYSDRGTVSARLVRKKGGERLMEVKELRVGPFQCPHCQKTLSQVDTGAFPNALLEPRIFHENHKPLD